MTIHCCLVHKPIQLVTPEGYRCFLLFPNLAYAQILVPAFSALLFVEKAWWGSRPAEGRRQTVDSEVQEVKIRDQHKNEKKNDYRRRSVMNVGLKTRDRKVSKRAVRVERVEGGRQADKAQKERRERLKGRGLTMR